MSNSEETDFNIKVPRTILVQCVSLLVKGCIQKETQKKQLKNIHENHIEEFTENEGAENRAFLFLGQIGDVDIIHHNGCMGICLMIH